MGLPSGTLWAVSNLDISSPGKFQPTPYQYECSFVSWGNIDAHNPISETEFDFDFGEVNAQAPWYEGQVYGSTLGAALTTNIPPSLDVARRELGGPWRMPTKEEFAELIANITFMQADGVTPIPSTTKNKLVTVEGVKGIYIKSNINGNMLFFACSGYGTGTQWKNRGTNGLCWSASFDSERNAFSLNFGGSGVYPQGSNNRNYGRAIRPVWNPHDKR
jgi:hypothetical protein